MLQLFTAPIIELGKVATAIKDGDMGARVKIGSVILRDEIDDLRRIFNGMAEEIATSHAQLEHKASLLDFFFSFSLLLLFSRGHVTRS